MRLRISASLADPWLGHEWELRVEEVAGDCDAFRYRIVLREYTGASKDYGYEQQHREQKFELDSIGFNAEWAVSDNFTLGFDIHDFTHPQPLLQVLLPSL